MREEGSTRCDTSCATKEHESMTEYVQSNAPLVFETGDWVRFLAQDHFCTPKMNRDLEVRDYLDRSLCMALTRIGSPYRPSTIRRTTLFQYEYRIKISLSCDACHAGHSDLTPVACILLHLPGTLQRRIPRLVSTAH